MIRMKSLTEITVNDVTIIIAIIIKINLLVDFLFLGLNAMKCKLDMMKLLHFSTKKWLTRPGNES